MKCPHCNYEHGSFNFEINNYVIGEKGDFFSLDIDMKKRNSIGCYEKTLWACPKCGKTFIEV